MTETVNVHDAKSQLSKLLDRAHAGEEITIAKAGKPYARLVPLAEFDAGPRPSGLIKGRLGDAFFDPLPPDELDRWLGKE